MKAIKASAIIPRMIKMTMFPTIHNIKRTFHVAVTLSWIDIDDNYINLYMQFSDKLNKIYKSKLLC